MADAQYIHGTTESEQERLAALNRLANPSFLAFLQLEGARTILEVGSGLGVLAREVALRVPEAEVIGVEYSTAQLSRAIDPPRNLRFVQGDAHQLDFEDNRFDVVYCRWVLEHVAAPLQVLKEMTRVARPGGRVFVLENDTSQQCYDPPAPQFDKVWQQLPILQSRLGGDALIGRRLFRLMKEAGLRDIRLEMASDVYHSGEPGFLVWVKNEQAILAGCAAEMVANHLCLLEDVEAAIAELQALLDRDDAASWFYWNRAVGLK
jgi:ubiquinone/menaquinone biosynthesis C-methylase UbiE